MRRIAGLAIFLALVVAACAGTPPAASPSAPSVPTVAAPTATTPIQPTATAASMLDAEPTAPAAVPLPTVAPTRTAAPAPIVAVESPWPRFLRELDFGVPAGNSYSPRALAIHPGLKRLYVRAHIRGPDYSEMGVVSMFDLDSGQVLAVAETGPDSYSEGQLAIDASRNRLYVLNTGEVTCSVLDATNLQVLATLDGVDRLALDRESGRLIIAGLAGLRVLDVSDYGTLRQVAVSYAPQFLALAVDVANNQISVAYRDNNGYALGLYDAATLQARVTVSLPGPPDDLLPDPERNHLYLTLNDGQHGLFWTLDSDGRLLEEQQLGDWTRHTRLAIDPDGDRLFLGRDLYSSYGITVRDLKTGQDSADLPLDTTPNALLWDADGGRLFVSQTYRNRIVSVDVEAGQVNAAYPTALNLVDLAVDPARGRFYVTDTAGRLHVMDAEPSAPVATLPGEGRISVDSPHGRLYTGGEGADRVRVFDADSLQQTGEIHSKAIPVADVHSGGLYLVRSGIYIANLETMTTTGVISDTLPEYPGYSPNPAAVDAVVDPGSGRLFAIINNGVPGSNNGNYLYVYEPLTYEKILTDTERSPAYVDVDPTTGRAYVSRIHMIGRSTSLLADGRRYEARLDAVFGALRVDPALGRVYLGDYGDTEGYLLVLDAANLDLLGSVPMPGGFTLRALDPQQHQIYLATEEGQVQIWSATGGELPAAVEPVPADLPIQEVRQLYLSPDDGVVFSGSLYRSDDGGRTWLYVGAGLPQRSVQRVVISPSFAQDHTLFTVLLATDESLGIWKSTDGGRSWRMANTGLSDLAVSRLAISPAFAKDGTLFATTRNQGLFRSTDGGQSWVLLTSHYHEPERYPDQPGIVVLSPTYAQDRTLFVAHYGLQRSTDGGQTWNQVFPQKPASLVLSPSLANDGMLFGWFSNGGLLRSTDGGQTWSAASIGLSLSDSGSGRLMAAPGDAANPTLYFVWTPSQPDTPSQFFRSTNAAATWQQLAGEPPQGASPVELSADGSAFLALDGSGQLARWPVAGLEWGEESLPPVDEITFDHLLLSPDLLLAVSEGAGILRSEDAGLTWADTRFPLRVTFGHAPQPVLVPPDTALVGTALGLYRYQGAGPWVPVGGGLPQGVAAGSPVVAEDGSLRLLVGSSGDQQVFLSTDAGQSWTLALPTLPSNATDENLLFSPAFAEDRAAFFAPSWGKPQRTSGGSSWAEFGPPGDWNLSAMQMSPVFDRDGLLVMRRDDQSLWRSTDQGDTWTAINGPWGDEGPFAVTTEGGYVLRPVTFSPAFAQDGVLLARAGDAIYRSTDTLAGTGQGGTWTMVLNLDRGFASAVFSPDYARDGTIYLLQDRTLYRSTDRGQKWQALPPAPWASDAEIQMQLSPAFATDHVLLAWTLSGQVYQSSDQGFSWRDASSGLGGATIREILFSPDYATDGLIFLVPHTSGLFKRVGESAWLPVTHNAPPPTPPTPTPRPTFTPAPLACSIEPDRFRSVWQQAGARLGCPVEPAAQVFFAEQPFEHGRMFWDSSTAQIYVLLETGTWQAFDDTFVQDVDPAYDPTLPPPPQQPERGFGKVWREQLGGPQSSIGWALEAEKPVNGWRQRFEHGLLVWSDGDQRGGIAYLLYGDGAWQAMPAPP
jgi:photosystem II stability/assembly factor-like uncharacterized protein/sugar lactone lactonase YvrE